MRLAERIGLGFKTEPRADRGYRANRLTRLVFYIVGLKRRGAATHKWVFFTDNYFGLSSSLCSRAMVAASTRFFAPNFENILVR